MQRADKMDADYAIARSNGGIIHVNSTEDGFITNGNISMNHHRLVATAGLAKQDILLNY